VEIYIKPTKKASIYRKKWVTISDVCDVFANKSDEQTIKELKLQKTGNKREAFHISVLDIVKVINSAFPGCTVNNVGETDILVEFSPTPHKPNAALNWLKIAFACIVLFVGSATVIMAFLTDSEMPKVFSRYHEILLGTAVENPYWISVPFAIGLAIGIVVFFNHFAGRKLSNDPTPIEVQMKLYENDVTDTRTSALQAMKERNEDVENPNA